MPKFKIAGIVLDFIYQCDPFFVDNIEKYSVSDETKSDYCMRTELCDAIDLPSGHPIIVFKNRQVYQTDQEINILNFDVEGNIQTSIKHTIDYKMIHIKLSRTLNERVAEQEYMLTGLLFSELAVSEDRLAIHGAAFVVQHQAVLIVGSSGVGKSTHANHWKSYIEPFMMINEDRPLISRENNQFYVSGTPWSGKTKANTNITVPLKTIVFYHPDSTNYIKILQSEDKLKQLMNHVLRPRGEVLMNHALNLIDDLLRFGDIIEYHAVDSSSSALTLFQYLLGGTE